MIGLSDLLSRRKQSVNGTSIVLLPKTQSSLDKHKRSPQDVSSSSSSLGSSSNSNKRRPSSSASLSPISTFLVSPPLHSKPLSIKSAGSATSSSRDRPIPSPVDVFPPMDNPASTSAPSSRYFPSYARRESPMQRDDKFLEDELEGGSEDNGDEDEHSLRDVGGGGGALTMGDGDVRSVTHQRVPKLQMPNIGNLIEFDEPDPSVDWPQNQRIHGAGPLIKMPPEVPKSMTPSVAGRLEATFEATNTNKERMFLLYESRGEDQVLYQIFLSTSILRPLCATTILQKGEEEAGQVVGHFEMGMNNKAYGSFKGNRFKHEGLDAVSRIRESKSLKFLWSPPDLNKELLRWVEPTNLPPNGPLTAKCYFNDSLSGQMIEMASFVTTEPGAALGLIQSAPREQLIIEEIALSAEYSTYLDDVVFSLLIFQRMVSNHRMNVL